MCCERISTVFRDEPEKVAENARALTDALTASAPGHDGTEESMTGCCRISPRAWCRRSIRCTAVCRARRSFRSGASSGCSGAAPSATATTPARAAVVNTLDNICQGGIYDHLGGGFSRYSVDERWLVPHFEKMLYDNALLIELMTEVYRETGSELLKTRIAETVAWLEREMIAEGGGFAASLDADSRGRGGQVLRLVAR